MKNLIFSGLSIAFASLGLIAGGCSADDMPAPSGDTGSLRCNISVDGSLASAVKARDTETNPDVAALSPSDLSLTLTNADGAQVGSWTSVDDFNPEAQWPIGAYTITASYGSPLAEGFAALYVTGSADVTVSKGAQTPVTISAAMANAMVTVNYTDAFRKYFTAFSATLDTSLGNKIAYPASESRPAYVQPGTVKLSLNVTKPSGASATLQPATIDAAARHHYVVTLDVNEGNVGDAALTVTFNETYDEEDVVIDLSDELIGAPAPLLKAKGFTPGTPLQVMEEHALSAPAGFEVYAEGGIGKLMLATSSPALIAKGWPAEVDLAASPATAEALGLKLSKGDKIAVIDLAAVMANVIYTEGGDNTVTFTLTPYDRVTKTCDPMTLAVEVTPNPYLLKVNSLDVYATRATVTCRVPDGETPSLVLTRGGSSVTPVFTTSGNLLTLTGLQGASDYTLTLKPAIDGEPDITVAFTTEAAAGVPNGDFEDLTQTINVTGLAQGGRYSITVIPAWQTNTFNLTVSEPTGWTSSNGTTFNNKAATQNTWYMCPSVFNSGLTAQSINAYPLSHAATTPSSYAGFTAHSGSTAMVLRNVAYDLNGPAISDDSKTTGKAGYYCRNKPSSIANRAAGTLSLDASFASRPTALKGWYSYTVDSNDTGETGVATVNLYSGSTLIASGSASLSAAAGYTQFTVPLTYTRTDLKATRLVVSLTSSNRSAGNIKTTDHCQLFLQESTGATLVVDNLTFTY